MARRTPAMLKLTRIEQRTKLIDGVRRLVFVVFCAVAGFVCVAMALPQRKHLDELEVQLEQAKKREILALADRENQLTENRAVREDPAYLEVQARDRLGLYREGEKVLKFSRDR